MADTVTRDVVIRVLAANGVIVSFEDNDPNDETKMVTLEKGKKLESMRIPARVGSRILQYLKRTYGCGIHEFYSPPPPQRTARTVH